MGGEGGMTVGQISKPLAFPQVLAIDLDPENSVSPL